MSITTTPYPATTDLTPEYLTVKNASQLLGLTPWACYKLLDAGAIDSRYSGPRRLVSYASLKTYAANLLPTEPSTECPAWCARTDHADGTTHHDSGDFALGDWRVYLASDGQHVSQGRPAINLDHVGGEPFLSPVEARALAQMLMEAAEAVERNRPVSSWHLSHRAGGC